MNQKERAVIEAARACFGKTVADGEVFLNGAVCTWKTDRLADAVRRLDGYPPYGRREAALEPEEPPR
jgi:hypothetical protein